MTTDGSYAVETHIYEQDLGKVEGEVWVEFVAFIRENRKFETLDVLAAQIKEDIEKSKELLR